MTSGRQQHKKPLYRWDGETLYFIIPVGENTVRAQLTPRERLVIQVRENGTGDWGPGFETPLTPIRILNLKPDTDYEIRITPMIEGREGSPTCEIVRTNGDGVLVGG